VIFVHEQNRIIKKLELKKQTNLASTKDTSENLIAEKSNSKDYIFHKVKKGETLYQIAKRNNVKVSDLINLNQLTNNSLLLGSYLKIKKINK
jgi:LysM repeat protein